MVNLLFTISTAMGGMVILLEDFIIHPNYRGQGYGTMLINHVADFAKKKGFKRMLGKAFDGVDDVFEEIFDIFD